MLVQRKNLFHNLAILAINALRSWLDHDLGTSTSIWSERTIPVLVAAERDGSRKMAKWGTIWTWDLLNKVSNLTSHRSSTGSSSGDMAYPCIRHVPADIFQLCHSSVRVNFMESHDTAAYSKQGRTWDLQRVRFPFPSSIVAIRWITVTFREAARHTLCLPN